MDFWTRCDMKDVSRDTWRKAQIDYIEASRMWYYMQHGVYIFRKRDPYTDRGPSVDMLIGNPRTKRWMVYPATGYQGRVHLYNMTWYTKRYGFILKQEENLDVYLRDLEKLIDSGLT